MQFFIQKRTKYPALPPCHNAVYITFHNKKKQRIFSYCHLTFRIDIVAFTIICRKIKKPFFSRSLLIYRSLTIHL